jgi:TldD protein
MVKFPDRLYGDIRIERTCQIDIVIENGVVKQNRLRQISGALIRIYDGDRWYYGVTTELEQLQAEVDRLSALASQTCDLTTDPLVARFEVNRERRLLYEASDISRIERQEKLDLLQSYAGLFTDYPQASLWKAYYRDVYETRTFISSKGADLIYDFQSAAVSLRYNLTAGGKQGRGGKDIVRQSFADLAGQADVFRAEIERDIAYTREAVPVKPGVYTCVLAPVVTGVFAHESFGHKSEADFMIGDEAMRQAWAIGSTVGSPDLSIFDRGDQPGSGYVPFDDEGTRARCNAIIQNGRLTGRLHSAVTAASLTEDLTGNARALNFEFEPIVRMTNTYIAGGTLTRDALLAPVAEGLYIEELNHGSGMTTFTIAPRRAYMIRAGQIAEPVLVSVISGNVMETLHKIDGFGDDLTFFSFALGGCGKMEQFPLRVGFGGPSIRVGGLQVQ